MKEIADILDLWRSLERNGDQAVLATVIRTRGSSYRLPGARLLIAPDGRHAGSISGGCLEDELLKKAWWLTESGPATRRYDTTSEGEIGSGYGLGCNGIIHIRLERLTPQTPSALTEIDAVWQTRRPTQYRHPSVDGEPPFVETLQPPIRLLIFGAGQDALPLTQFAGFLGWHTHIYDGRAHYIKSQSFPHAGRVELRTPATQIPIDPWTVAVLMSHSYSQDLEVLKQLASNPPAYIGLLGPRKRSLQLLSDANLAETQLSPTLHAPMGLDIGADGPQQVALSVLAEIQAYLNGREGGELRLRKGSIHAQTADDLAGARAQDDEAVPFRVHSIACA
jgi:xanthine dehydrogenase accessory factor